MRIPTSFYRDGWWMVVAYPLYIAPHFAFDSDWKWIGTVPMFTLALMSRKRRIEETGE